MSVAKGTVASTAVWLVLGCGVLPEYDGPKPAAGSDCHPARVGFRAEQGFSWDGQHDPDCRVDAEGAASLIFTPEATCLDPNPWRSCLLARHQDMTPFFAGRGVYEATVCVDGPLPGSIQLKVEYAPDAEGRMQQQQVLTALQPFQRMSDGCARVVFRSDDLSLPAQCAERSGEGLACSETPAQISPLGLDNALKDAQLLLTTTDCDATRLPKKPGPVVLSLTKLFYYPSACFCHDAGDCAAGQYCDADGWPDLACCRCAESCPSICRPLSD